MNKYCLWLIYKDHAQDYYDDYKEFVSLEEALDVINKCSELFTFRLMEGREIELKAVEVVTRYVVKGG